MHRKLTLKSEKLKREKKIKKIFMLILIIIMLLLLLAYFVVGIIYNSGNFSITLDKNLYFDKGLIVYDDFNYKVYRTELFAEVPETFDNIYYKWLPADIHDYEGGSHNGKNYFAYTFYIENTGEQNSDYWTELVIDDVIKNVDEALRVMIILNGEKTVYAKLNSTTNEPEKGTKAFYSQDRIAVECREDFTSGEIDKCTVVIWVEGNDPECLDNLIGGEIKMHMSIMEDHIIQEN